MPDPDQSTLSARTLEGDNPRATGWAWVLCWVMFASTVLNYMDRQTINLVEGPIRESFSIPDFAGFGWILSAFFMTYALFQVPAGYLVDRWDLRWCYAAAVAWWSLAAIATAVAPSLGWLIACRALLGVGESFNWPCALRVTARVLPPRDRSLGNGIFNSGAAVGAVLTPLIVASLMPKLGWRATFLAIGAAGFVWVAAWLFLVRGPRSGMLAGRQAEAAGKAPGSKGWHRLSLPARTAFACVFIVAVGLAVSAKWYGQSAMWLGIALAMLGPLAVAAVFPRQHLAGAGWATSLHEIARLRRFWILVVVSISINICWHFLINWIPTFLSRERHMLGPLACIPERRHVLGRRPGQPGRRVALALACRPRRQRGPRTQDCDVALHDLDPDRPSPGPPPRRRFRHRPPLDHGGRHGRIHGQLFFIHSGSLFSTHWAGCRLSGWTRKFIRGGLFAFRRRAQRLDAQLHGQLRDSGAGATRWNCCLALGLG